MAVPQVMDSVRFMALFRASYGRVRRQARSEQLVAPRKDWYLGLDLELSFRLA